MIKLNCDLGEGLDDVDCAVMPHIDMASIACGGHTGTEQSMTRTVALAKANGVEIGAHPSYPSPADFGRSSMDIGVQELEIALHEQISKLKTVCNEQNTTLTYIKPHGALYNDILHCAPLAALLGQICDQLSLPLVTLATNKKTAIIEYARANRVTLIFEGFADRAYTPDGSLVARAQPHAVHHDSTKIIEQAKNLAARGGTYTENNKWIELNVDTLCVHSDTVGAVSGIKQLQTLLK